VSLPNSHMPKAAVMAVDDPAYYACSIAVSNPSLNNHTFFEPGCEPCCCCPCWLRPYDLLLHA
jgi:hypothetical protein